MTVLTVAQNASLVLGLEVPTQLYGATSRDAVEMGNMLNRIRSRIRDEFDWQALQEQATIVGDAVTEGFDLPSNYYRMLLDSNLYNSDIPGWRVTRIEGADEWLQWKVSLVNPFSRIWALISNRIHILPVLPLLSEVLYYYIRDTDVRAADNSLKSSFTVDTDSYVLDEELLELALVWNWKAAKSLPYAKELNDYEVKLSSLCGADRGNRIVRTGALRIPRGANIAYPWPLGV